MIRVPLRVYAAPETANPPAAVVRWPGPGNAGEVEDGSTLPAPLARRLRNLLTRPFEQAARVGPADDETAPVQVDPRADRASFFLAMQRCFGELGLFVEWGLLHDDVPDADGSS